MANPKLGQVEFVGPVRRGRPPAIRAKGTAPDANAKMPTTIALEPEIKIMLEGLMVMQNERAMNAVIAKTTRAFIESMPKDRREELNAYVRFRQAALIRSLGKDTE